MKIDTRSLKCLLGFIPDKLYLQLYYFVKFGRFINFNNPKTFNEKLQWLKLNDRNPEYTKMVDKYEAKKYITEILGEEYVIPTYGVWDRFDDINFDELPNQFVLKCTHDSHGLVICKDKSKLDIKAARKQITKCLKQNYYNISREYVYKSIKPRIIAEKYMVDESGYELKDYKIFCFNGRAEYIEVDFNRAVEHKLNPYDFEWNLLGFCDSSPNDPNADIKKPKKLDEMKDIAEKLSEGITFLRVDFYYVNDNIYIGELTFYPGGGFIQYNPSSFDLKYGSLLKLEEN